MVRSARPKSLLALVALALLLPSAAAPAATKKKGTSKPKSAASSSAKKPAAGKRETPVVSPVAPESDPVALTPGMKLPVPEIPPDLKELPLAARGAIVVDSNTGEALYEKNADQPQYPASTTKIMTALLIIESGDLDRLIEVTDEDAKVGESSLNIRPGDHFSRREGLYGLLLKSANDVAWALGRDNAGTMDAFAAKMTTRAQELGATNTHFANPHGLHNLQHYTSPRDLALIARAAMQQPFFRQIVGTQFHPWSIRSTGAVELRNHNRLLWMFPGCIGVKTGYTVPAQQVLVSSAQWGTREAISVVMHTDKPGIWDDSKLLLTFALQRAQAQEP